MWAEKVGERRERLALLIWNDGKTCKELELRGGLFPLTTLKGGWTTTNLENHLNKCIFIYGNFEKVAA